MKKYLLAAAFATGALITNTAVAGFIAPTLTMKSDGSISAYYKVESQNTPYEVNFKKIEDNYSSYNKILIKINDFYIKPDSQFIVGRKAQYIDYGDHDSDIFEGNPDNNNMLYPELSCVECGISITLNLEDLNVKKILYTIDQFKAEPILAQLAILSNQLSDNVIEKMLEPTLETYNERLADELFFSERTNKDLLTGIDYFYGACDFSTDPNCDYYGYMYGETANVEEVPLPATAWLFGSALMSLYLRKNK